MGVEPFDPSPSLFYVTFDPGFESIKIFGIGYYRGDSPISIGDTSEFLTALFWWVIKPSSTKVDASLPIGVIAWLVYGVFSSILLPMILICWPKSKASFEGIELLLLGTSTLPFSIVFYLSLYKVANFYDLFSLLLISFGDVGEWFYIRVGSVSVFITVGYYDYNYLFFGF